MLLDLAKVRSATTDEEKKAFWDDKGVAFLKRLESKLEKNGGQFLVGKAVREVSLSFNSIFRNLENLALALWLIFHPTSIKHTSSMLENHSKFVFFLCELQKVFILSTPPIHDSVT